MLRLAQYLQPVLTESGTSRTHKTRQNPKIVPAAKLADFTTFSDERKQQGCHFHGKQFYPRESKIADKFTGDEMRDRAK